MILNKINKLISYTFCITLSFIFISGTTSKTFETIDKMNAHYYEQPIVLAHDLPESKASMFGIEKKEKTIESPKKENKSVIQCFPNMAPSKGVYYYGGKRFTWYSSQRRPHYLIGGWHVDEKGFWRDSNNYIVVAYTMDLPYGTKVDLGNGCMGAVWDHCPTPNTVDIYVNW